MCKATPSGVHCGTPQRGRTKKKRATVGRRRSQFSLFFPFSPLARCLPPRAAGPVTVSGALRPLGNGHGRPAGGATSAAPGRVRRTSASCCRGRPPCPPEACRHHQPGTTMAGAAVGGTEAGARRRPRRRAGAAIGAAAAAVAVAGAAAGVEGELVVGSVLRVLCCCTRWRWEREELLLLRDCPDTNAPPSSPHTQPVRRLRRPRRQRRRRA